MWKILYYLSSPRNFYQVSTRLTPWLITLASIFLLVGSVLGLWFAPPDYQQGDAFRILYVHVPAAFLSISLYATMGFLALLLLVWRIKLAGILLPIFAQIGACMTLVALITGSIWGKPMWGTYWIWDARLTSELILFFLYITILAVRSMYRDLNQADRLAAILALVGLIDLPIIHYSVYWWNTLHQGATLSLFSKPTIDASMLAPLLLMITGCALYCAWFVLYKGRFEVLLRERRQRWVMMLFQKGI